MINLIKKLFEKQGMRFLFVGGLNTAVGYGMFALFIYIGFNYVVAQTLSTVIGMTHSYFWNKFFTFRKKGGSASEVLRFIGVSGVQYLVNLGILYLCVDILGLTEYAAGAVSLVFSTAVSYFGHKLISFRKPKKHF